MKIYIHSDDYGISAAQSERIALSARHGALNSVSILANSPVLEQIMGLLDETPQIQYRRIHLNFVEGKCSSRPEDIPLLVSPDGYFRLSYEKLLLRSLLPGSKLLKSQLKTEIRSQLAVMRPYLPWEGGLYLDTHQHTHAIPVVLRAICEVIQEDALKVRYLRDPYESLLPFLKHPGVLLSIPIENYIKQGLLAVLALANRKCVKAAGIPTAAFFGVLMTGGVSSTQVLRMLPDLARYARRKGQDLELLFHPARIQTLGECPDEKKRSFTQFNMSPHRDIEFQTLLDIKPVLADLEEPASV